MSINIDFLVKSFDLPIDAEVLITLDAPFDWSSTSEVILKLEKRIGELEISTKGKKYIAKIITESIDNVCRHVLKKKELNQLSSFICALFEDKLYISTRNLIDKEAEIHLIEIIDTLNSLSKEDLDQRFRNQLKHGHLDNEGNAGLGLLEITRKGNEKIKYHFEKHTDDLSFFTLFITVNTSKFK
jgi:hypothetical protein